MKHAVFLTLLASLAASTRLSQSTNLHGEVVQGYVDDLVKGLPDESTTERVRESLRKLEPESVKVMHSVCCKDGECAKGAAAFLVEHCSTFAEGVKIDECVQQLASHFMAYVKPFDDLPDELKFPAVTPNNTTFAKGLGLWYIDTRCKAEVAPSPKEALSYVLLSDGGAENAGIRARIVLGSIGWKDSETLAEYWTAQGANRLLTIYRMPEGDEYRDLTILQPVIFNENSMDCIKTGNCDEEDYCVALRTHTDPLRSFPLLFTLIVALWELPFPRVAMILRNLTGKRSMGVDEALAMMARELVVQSRPSKELGELVYQAQSPEFYVPESYPSYSILDAGNVETWVVLDHQILDLIPDWKDFVPSIPFFPHTRVAKYITKRYNALTQYVRFYEGAVQGILEKVLSTHLKDWAHVSPSPTEDFDETIFWQLFAVLEKEQNRHYGGLFRHLIFLRHLMPEMLGELAPNGLNVLVQKILECTDETQLHKDLDNIAMSLLKLTLSDHPFFDDRFETARQQLKDGLLKVFGVPPNLWTSLGRYILNFPAEVGGSDGLHDLQVDSLAHKLAPAQKNPTKNQEWRTILKEYNTRQLANINESDLTVLIALKHCQLRENVDLNKPVEGNQLLHKLSELYQLAFPHRESVLGQKLRHLSQDSTETSSCFGCKARLVAAFMDLPKNQDFSTAGDDSPWHIVDRNWYNSMDRNVQFSMLQHMYPELANIHPPDDAAVDQCETFDQLLKIMTTGNEKANGM